MSPSNTISKNRISALEQSDSIESKEDLELSIVVPLFNENQTLETLCEKLFEALGRKRIEIIFVDDGSRDKSWETIDKLAKENPNVVHGLRHRRNFGKADALSTGFQFAKGKTVVTLDADLQDDPAEIPALIAKLDEGYDLVSGWKQQRNDPISKTIPSFFFNFAARAVSGVKLHDFNCGLKAYRREAIENLKLYGELHRFIPILVESEGFRVTEIPVCHFPREYGVSKYGWKRIFKGSLDLVTVVLLTRYLKRPGHFFGGIGLALGTAGFAILSYLSIMKIAFGENIGTRPLFFLGLLLFLFAGQLVSTGVIGEFLLRHHPRGDTKNANQIQDRTGDSTELGD